MTSSPADFRDAAVVLVAHGSTVNSDSASPTFLQADELRRRGLFGEVHEAFWKQEPGIRSALRGIFSPRVFVVPMFMADGWFTRHVIPVQLGLKAPGTDRFDSNQVLEGRHFSYCPPIGTHPLITEVLLSRARRIVERHPFPRQPSPEDTALFVVGHGTSYSRGSHDGVETQVARVRAMGLYAEVRGVFLEESPRVEECWDLTAARNLVVVPFFVSDGLHTREDIPVMLGAPERVVRQRLAAGRDPWPNPTERKGRRLWLSGALGTEPRLTDVILERVREAAVGFGC